MSGFASLSTFVYAVMVLRATLGQNVTNFQFPCGPQDCADAACWNDKREWPTLNHPVSEPFFPKSKQGESKEAICDYLHAATLVVRRNRDVPSVTFKRTWQDYENGFGVSGNHWLGLKHLHRLSSRGKQMISLIYRIQNGNESHVLDGAWDSFTVDSAVNLYKLSLGPSRMSIDVMQSAKGQPFYNGDKIKTSETIRCGSRFSGGWWFGNCSGLTSDLINLNGQFNATDADKSVFVGTHVVISAEIRMQPFLYERDNYACDKTCPNGGTCHLASDKASYFCSCLPTFTGWRCESLSNARSITTMTTAKKLVKPHSQGEKTQNIPLDMDNTGLEPPPEVSGKIIYIGVILSTTICLLAFIIASQVAVWQWKKYKDSDENEIPLLHNRSKRRDKGKLKPKKHSILPEQSTRNDASVAESVLTSRSHREDTPTGKPAKAIRPQKKDKPTGVSVKASVSLMDATSTIESVISKLTRSHRDDTESVQTTRPGKKEKPKYTSAGESSMSQARQQTKDTDSRRHKKKKSKKRHSIYSKNN